MPTNKVMIGAAIGALSTIVVWAIHQFAKIEIPVEISAAGQTVLVFLAQYFTPNSQPQVTAQQKTIDASASQT